MPANIETELALKVCNLLPGDLHLENELGFYFGRPDGIIPAGSTASFSAGLGEKKTAMGFRYLAWDSGFFDITLRLPNLGPGLHDVKAPPGYAAHVNLERRDNRRAIAYIAFRAIHLHSAVRLF